MKLSGTERETIVLYNEAEAAASIYTHNAALCRQLRSEERRVGKECGS